MTLLPDFSCESNEGASIGGHAIDTCTFGVAVGAPLGAWRRLAAERAGYTEPRAGLADACDCGTGLRAMFAAYASLVSTRRAVTNVAGPLAFATFGIRLTIGTLAVLCFARRAPMPIMAAIVITSPTSTAPASGSVARVGRARVWLRA